MDSLAQCHAAHLSKGSTVISTGQRGVAGSNELCQGLFGCGTIFKSTTGGELSVLYTFDSTHGSHPFASPVQGADGNFYGTTDNGGAYNGGTVFKLTSDGVLTTLYDLNGTSGEFSTGGLLGMELSMGLRRLEELIPTGLFSASLPTEHSILSTASALRSIAPTVKRPMTG